VPCADLVPSPGSEPDETPALLQPIIPGRPSMWTRGKGARGAGPQAKGAPLLRDATAKMMFPAETALPRLPGHEPHAVVRWVSAGEKDKAPDRPQGNNQDQRGGEVEVGGRARIPPRGWGLRAPVRGLAVLDPAVRTAAPY
jgi:hypothetical protein